MIRASSQVSAKGADPTRQSPGHAQLCFPVMCRESNRKVYRFGRKKQWWLEVSLQKVGRLGLPGPRPLHTHSFPLERKPTAMFNTVMGVGGSAAAKRYPMAGRERLQCHSSV